MDVALAVVSFSVAATSKQEVGARRLTSTHAIYKVAWTRRHRKFTVAMVAVVLLTPIWWSIGSALSNPSMGVTLPGRLAEWFRGHGGASIVVWAENQWYSHHPPPVGGRPARGLIVDPRSTTTTTQPAAPLHLDPPLPMTAFANPPLPGEGVWQPVGRTVDGIPAAYATRLRPDAVHTSVVVGVVWMDTELLSARLYSGSQIPGGTGWTYSAPVSTQAAATLDIAFNSGFLMSNANGGYYSEGRTVFPLRQGAASLVIYDNGTATVGEWGRDVSMTPEVASVRQNLQLIVDNGRPVPGLNSNDTTQWGYTLGNKVYVWRSGLGVTADGALVYVGGPDLNITDLANVLADAGAIRAMELDINTDWVNCAIYSPSSTDGIATPSNGTDLLPTMAGSPARYFTASWARDFVTMSVRAPQTAQVVRPAVTSSP